MKKVKELKIDKCYKPKELYRYNAKFEDNSSIGSCFCYETFEDAFLDCEFYLSIHM